jgi:hypothetical protein
MSSQTPSFRLLSPATLTLALLVGCAGTPPPPEEVQARLTLAQVPPEVACVRITATGPGRTVEREIGVSAGAMINEAFSGLPLGTVLFKGEAFTGDCEAVTKSTIPGWASEPETVAIVLGRQTTISLTLNRNGRAKVNVDFNDEPTCTESGGACIASAACCSKTCSKGLCQAPDAGPPDAL